MSRTADRAAPGAVPDSPAGPGRRWPRRVLLGVVLALTVLLVAALATAVWTVRRPFPQTAGSASLPGLDAAVEVHRDDLGVPTLVATTTSDLHRALGYVHAQDRFWQMDSWRHIARGRTAELFGDGQLATDRFLRSLGWEQVATAEYDLLAPETRRLLDEYAQGVNAYLDARPRRALGLEYSVLGLTNPDYRPRPWEPVDSLAFMKLMAWDLRGNLDAEIERAVLAAQLPPDLLADLYPPYDAAPVIVDDWGPAGDLHRDVDWAAVQPLLERVADAAAAVPSPTPPGVDGIGSNNWVIAGEHTDTGAPILADDPHLGIQMPSIWYQAALRCAPDADPAACDLDVTGFSFPGVPGAIIGHNADIAWGVTNLGADVMDLYVERLNPEDPRQYEVEGEWVDMEVRTETLRSADGSEEVLEVRSTRNGPLISDVYAPLDDLDPAGLAEAQDAQRYALALRWTALEPRPMLDVLPQLNRAGDWDEFRAALRSFFVPGQNFVYADTDGTIGYQATGIVPIRGAGDGRVPVPGWDDDYQWTGYVPYEDLPSVRDPDEGWIATANNPPVGDDYPYLLGTDWDHGQRAARIEELLRASDRPVSLDDVQRQQLDNHQHAADWLVPAIAAADPAGAGDAAAAARARLAQETLGAWDARMDAESAGAAVFAATWRQLLAALFHARLPERYHPAGGARWFEAVRRLVDEPEARWWDNPATQRTETRDETLAAAAAAGVAELEERLGADPDDWAWGDLHTATFRNATLGESGVGAIEARFNRGPYPVGGSTSIVNAVGWHAPAGYAVTWLPSLRMIVDLDDLDRSRGIHTTGQSGHAYHRNYTSMIEPWAAGEQRRMRWDLDALAAGAAATLRLEP